LADANGVYINQDEIPKVLKVRHFMCRDNSDVAVLSLLYYFGAVTLAPLLPGETSGLRFRIPNKVTKTEFIDNITEYVNSLLSTKESQEVRLVTMDFVQSPTALTLSKLCGIYEQVLLSPMKGNDVVHCREMDLKTIFLSALCSCGFRVQSEFGKTQADLTLSTHRIHFELKHISIAALKLWTSTANSGKYSDTWSEQTRIAKEIQSMTEEGVLSLEIDADSLPYKYETKHYMPGTTISSVRILLEECKAQARKNKLKLEKEFPGAPFNTFVIVRVGLYKLVCADID
jgi:hypothetical protein